MTHAMPTLSLVLEAATFWVGNVGVAQFVGESQFGRERPQLLKRIAVPDGHRVEVRVPERVTQIVQRPQHVVDAVLRIHRPEVTEDDARLAPERRVRLGQPHAREIRAVANDEHPRGIDAVALDVNVPIALVGGNQHVSQFDGRLLEHGEPA